MSVRRFAGGAGTVLLALLLQTTVLARLPLPGSPPDLVLVLVVAWALAEGPLSGLVTGFAAGLLADLMTDHPAGRLALAYLVAGYLAGLAQDAAERGAVLSFAVVGGCAAVALLVYAGQGLLLGDVRVAGDIVLRGLVSAVPYDVALTPVVVPAVRALARRVQPETVHR